MKHQDLFFIFAKKRNSSQSADDWLSRLLPGTFPRTKSDWWVDVEHGVALYSPERADAWRGGGFDHSQSDACWKSVLEQVGLAWNYAEKEFVIERRYPGQEAVYLRETDEGFYGASSLSHLLDAFDSCTLDIQSAIRYLFNGQPLRGRTLATEVRKLPVGHALRWRRGQRVIIARSETLLGHKSQKVPTQNEINEIKRELDTSIRTTCAIGKNALLLSGGVDSSRVEPKVA